MIENLDTNIYYDKKKHKWEKTQDWYTTNTKISIICLYTKILLKNKFNIKPQWIFMYFNVPKNI